MPKEYYSVGEDTPFYDFDKVLRLAVLDRAVRDLESEHRFIVRAAIVWFRSDYRGTRNKNFTWLGIQEDLDLSKVQLDYIELRVRAAEGFELPILTGIKCRVRKRFRVDYKK